MKNKTVGHIILILGATIGFIIYIFNKALSNIVISSCSHGPTCTMWDTIEYQTNISIGIMAIIILIGLYLTFFGEEKNLKKEIKRLKNKNKPRIKVITKENYKDILETLDENEKKIVEIIIEDKGSTYQSNLFEKTEFSRVKITRILDRLEGKNIVERKRRGMTNIVLLKHQ